MPENTARYQFILKDDDCALLDSWAKDDYYDNDPRYLRFLCTIRQSDAALKEFQTLVRIFRKRGVYRTLQLIEIIEFLFPGYMFFPKYRFVLGQSANLAQINFPPL
jgi:hypothetical protein